MKTLLARRVGTEEKEPETVRLAAGELAADFVAGGLRAIRYQGHEVLRAIAYVVRDAAWGTYTPEISACRIDQSSESFAVTYQARCVSSDAAQVLSYRAQITGNAQGQLLFEVVAEPLTAFATARCGFAVLHPIDGVAGHTVIVEHVDGSQEEAKFPEFISPAQPFKDIRALQHSVANGITARCSLHGDTFEMEDQRNWSDASYKTYVRPLALPWPYVLEPGVRNRQAVEVDIQRTPGMPAAPVLHQDGPVRVAVGGIQGVFPGIGVSIYPDLPNAALAHKLLARLRPQLVLLHCDLTAGHGMDQLRYFAELGRAVPASDKTELVLELVLAARSSVSDELANVAALAADAGLKLSGILVSPAVDRKSTIPGTPWPPCPPPQRDLPGCAPGFSRPSAGRWLAGLLHRAEPQAAAA